MIVKALLFAVAWMLIAIVVGIALGKLLKWSNDEAIRNRHRAGGTRIGVVRDSGRISWQRDI